MNSPPQLADIPMGTYTEDFWTTRPTKWPTTPTVHGLAADRDTPRSITHIRDYHDEDDPVDQSMPARVKNIVAVPPAHPDTKTITGESIHSTGPESDQRSGLKEYLRGDIELQLATMNKYIQNKKLKPIEWTCCSCSKEQKYRENLEPLDRLRCQYPRCGVSDKGFRIYRIHNMCEHCALFVDQRAPVTKKALKRKRDEVREVLRKIKKIYEDVDCLADFDDKEAADMATLVKEKEAREELERERQEERDLAQVEIERQQKQEWADDDDDDDDDGGDNSDTASQHADAEETTEPEEWGKEARRRQRRGENKVQKKRGFKGFLGL